MSGVGGINTNQTSTTAVNADNTVANNNEITKEQKNNYENTTKIDNLAGVAKSSSGKAGRIIAGILGGILLAVGIAAATVAVTASFGVAAGILGTAAAFMGITGASVTAGAAGAAGIGLITCSALSPKHPEVPAENHGVKNTSTETKVNAELNVNEKQFLSDKNISNKISAIISSYDDTGKDDPVNIPSVFNRKLIKVIVENVLGKANIDATKVSQEGVDAIKKAIDNSCKTMKADKDEKNVAIANKFDNPDYKNKIAKQLDGDKGYAYMEMFAQALSSEEPQDNNIILA